jgi:hypothetical protein
MISSGNWCKNTLQDSQLTFFLKTNALIGVRSQVLAPPLPLQGLGTIESHSLNISYKIGVSHMSVLDWFFTSFFIILYIFLLFTVCFLTFRKGYFVLGIIGIFIPFLWLIGAILPAKRGSQYEIAERARMQA